MTDTLASVAATGTKRTMLLLDQGHTDQYGLSEIVDNAAKRLVGRNENLYAPLLRWREGFAFEKKLGEDTPLARHAATRDMSVAIATTWQHQAGHAGFCRMLNTYDVVYSVRAAPIIQAMSAWLSTYRNAMSRLLEDIRSRQAAEHQSAKSPSCPDKDVESRLVDDARYLGEMFERQKNMRSVLILRNAFRFGFNKNLHDPASPRITKYKSRLLFGFDIGRANRMLQMLEAIKDPAAHTGEMMIKGDVVINMEDYFMRGSCGTGASAIFRRMLMDTERITHVKIVQGDRIFEELGSGRTCKTLMMLSRKHDHHGKSNLPRELLGLDPRLVVAK